MFRSYLVPIIPNNVEYLLGTLRYYGKAMLVNTMRCVEHSMNEIGINK